MLLILEMWVQNLLLISASNHPYIFTEICSFCQCQKEKRKEKKIFEPGTRRNFSYFSYFVVGSTWLIPGIWVQTVLLILEVWVQNLVNTGDISTNHVVNTGQYKLCC